jgi:hypothetical protein
MSTKTLRKRIALVAVAALGAGVLSVAPANAAEDGTISGDASSNGLSTSVGLLAGAVGQAPGKTMVAVLLKTGTLTIDFDSTNTGYAAITSGDAYVSAADAIDANQQGGTGATVSIKPNGAVGSTFTVSTYDSDAAGEALVHKVTVTVAGTSVAGVASVANSVVHWVAEDGDAGDVEISTNAATTTGLLLSLNVILKDAYKAPITSESGALIVTASTGAVVKISAHAAGTPDKGTAATAVSAEDPSDLTISVGEATAGAGWNGTVTVTYNGVTIATKSGKITGKITKLAVTAKKIGTNSGGSNNSESLEYQATDAAGNVVPLAHGSLAFTSSSVAGLVTTITGETTNSSTAAGKAGFTCADSSSLSGKTDIVLQTVLDDGTTITSAPTTVQCGGAADSYKASWDKATYAQGDIATLTVSFLDANGAAANSYSSVVATPTADIDAAITANQMERVTAIVADAKPDANGQIKYTFTVGTSVGSIAGKYNAVVSFGTVNAESGTNQSVGYEIIATGAGVSNADVLKAIVSLIASINKQIAALQKALLKRR